MQNLCWPSDGLRIGKLGQKLCLAKLSIDPLGKFIYHVRAYSPKVIPNNLHFKASVSWLGFKVIWTAYLSKCSEGLVIPKYFPDNFWSVTPFGIWYWSIARLKIDWSSAATPGMEPVNCWQNLANFLSMYYIGYWAKSMLDSTGTSVWTYSW